MSWIKTVSVLGDLPVKKQLCPLTKTQCLMWPWGSAAAQLLPAGRTSALSPVVPSRWQWWEGVRDSRACFHWKYSLENAVVVGWTLLVWQCCPCTRIMGGKSTLAKQSKFKQPLIQNLAGFLVASLHKGLLPAEQCLSEIASLHILADSHVPGQVCAANVT